VKLTVEQTYGGLAPEDYAILQGIKENLPAAILSHRRPF
jgi:hypothetical protein